MMCTQQERCCADQPSEDARMERATPAKRARDRAASLAPPPQLEAESDAASRNDEMERRVRRRMAAAPDQDEVSSAQLSGASLISTGAASRRSLPPAQSQAALQRFPALSPVREHPQGAGEWL